MQTKNIKTLVAAGCILLSAVVMVGISSTTHAVFEVGGDHSRPAADRTKPPTTEVPPQTQEPSRDDNTGVNTDLNDTDQNSVKTDNPTAEGSEGMRMERTENMAPMLTSALAIMVLVLVGLVLVHSKSKLKSKRKNKK